MSITDKIVNISSGRPVRTRRNAADARENILAAAQAMLIAEGPQVLKLAEVARAAGVSNASVLHHFGSIAGVQTTLMERMVASLVDDVLAITLDPADPVVSAGRGIAALFAAFETKGAARLAAWLELTGESRRLTMVRQAVREVIDRDVMAYPDAPVGPLEDFILVSISTALGVGLFGATLSQLLGKPPERARDTALAILIDQLRHTLASFDFPRDKPL